MCVCMCVCIYIYIYANVLCQSSMNQSGPDVYFCFWSGTVLRPIRPAMVADQVPPPWTATYINSYRILGCGDMKCSSNYGRFVATQCLHCPHTLPTSFSFLWSSKLLRSSSLSSALYSPSHTHTPLSAPCTQTPPPKYVTSCSWEAIL